MTARPVLFTFSEAVESRRNLDKSPQQYFPIIFGRISQLPPYLLPRIMSMPVAAFVEQVNSMLESNFILIRKFRLGEAKPLIILALSRRHYSSGSAAGTCSSTIPLAMSVHSLLSGVRPISSMYSFPVAVSIM